MRRRARFAIVVGTSLVIADLVGCGGFLGFGSPDPEDTPDDGRDAPNDAAASDGASSAEGGSTVDVDDGETSNADGSGAVDAGSDVMIQPDGRACVLAGTCAKSVFDCCSEMDDPGGAGCGGICGVDICCF